MAYKIDDYGKIYLTRGDTFEVGISIYNSDGSDYVPSDGDAIYFALKSPKMTSGERDFVDKEPLLYIQIPNETLTLTISSDQTNSLSFGYYKYDIALIHANGKVDTFIPLNDFILTPEVH